MSELHRISTTESGAATGDVVLIHGLGGHYRQTWQHGKDEDSFWPSWLCADIPSVNIWSLSYPTSWLDLKGDAMALPDRARNILAQFETAGLGQRRVLFVAHSLGGILVKQLLRAGQDSGRPAWRDIVKHTAGIFFLATPHTGSEKATWFTNLVQILASAETLRELKEHSPHLRDLNLWYRANAPSLGIATEVVYETQSTRGLRIVDETSSDPGVSGVIPIPIDADHLSISKFSTHSDIVYGMLRKFVASRLSADYVTRSSKASRKLIAYIDTIETETDARSSAARARTMGQMTEVAQSAFPYGDSKYPEGSFVQTSPSSIAFVINKPTVALRAAIEFMQAWHRLVSQGEPDCRVTIDYAIDGQFTSGLCTANALSLLPLPAIYLTDTVIDACDPTLASFRPHCAIPGPPTVAAYRAEFGDPRTVADSSLVHALFIAQPDADEARERLLELFIAEYLIEHQSISQLSDLLVWMFTKGYPCPPVAYLETLILKSRYFRREGSPGVVTLTGEASQVIQGAKEEYIKAKELCIADVEAEILKSTRTQKSLSNIDLPKLIDDYLVAIFLEIRLMANYVRRTAQIFDGSSELLRPFDYIILSQLKDLREVAIETWKGAFLRGLKTASVKGNAYIAAVFHNVLATYYLNRGATQRQFQVDRIKGRSLYLDTNVLYAALVKASSYYDIIRYCLTSLTKLGFKLKIFPFSITEYEHSLARVERGFVNGSPLPWLAQENPWLYQEFQLRKGRYITIGACRKVHSVAKKETITPADFDAIDYVLASHDIELERDWVPVDKDAVGAIWSDWINRMSSNSWDMDRWWEFRHTSLTKSDQTIQHDVDFVTNVENKAVVAPADEFGPRVVLLTLDHGHILRLRHKYPFIIGVRQCQEFFLPYLFLNDIPVKETMQFPNRLLDAQLGTMLVTRPLKAQDIVESFLATEDLEEDPSERAKKFPREFRDIATALSSERFTNAMNGLRVLPREDRAVSVESIAAAVEELHERAISRAFDERVAREEIAHLKAELQSEKRRSTKLAKTNQYLRGQRGRERE